MSKFNLTQKETARLIELILMGSEVVGASLELSLEFYTLLEASGAMDVQKSAKAQIIQHPELEETRHDVTLKVVPDAKFEIDTRAIDRDPHMKAIYEATLKEKQDSVTVTASDMGLRSRSEKDMKFLKPVMGTAWKLKVVRAKKA